MSRQSRGSPGATPPPADPNPLSPGQQLVTAWLTDATTGDTVMDVILSLLAESIGHALLESRPKAA